MEWRDNGIVLGTRGHGETSAIVEVMTSRNGRHLGLVRGGRSRRLRAVLQTGNAVDLVWRARLHEHLGTFQIEPVEMNAARFMASALAIHGLQTVAAHLRLLPERDPHDDLYRALRVLVDHLHEPSVAGELVVRFELMMLEELGFGLDLGSCAATGRRDDLVYVSPRSGRAVSRDAGAAWHDKMLALPAFLSDGGQGETDGRGLADAFRLTGHFFFTHVYQPRGMTEPAARNRFVRVATESLRQADADHNLPLDRV